MTGRHKFCFFSNSEKKNLLNTKRVYTMDIPRILSVPGLKYANSFENQIIATYIFSITIQFHFKIIYKGL